MKRFLNYSALALLAIIVLASCTKNRDVYQNDEWEIATVVNYEDGTPYTIIQYQNDRTYGILESVDANTSLWPDRGEILEGVFIEGRQTRIYNRTAGFHANIYIVENVNSLDEAYDALYYYNDTYGIKRSIDIKGLKSKEFLKSQSGRSNIK